jgi:hypothetical protein
VPPARSGGGEVGRDRVELEAQQIGVGAEQIGEDRVDGVARPRRCAVQCADACCVSEGVLLRHAVTSRFRFETRWPIRR